MELVSELDQRPPALRVARETLDEMDTRDTSHLTLLSAKRRR